MLTRSQRQAFGERAYRKSLPTVAMPSRRNNEERNMKTERNMSVSRGWCKGGYARMRSMIAVVEMAGVRGR